MLWCVGSHEPSLLDNVESTEIISYACFSMGMVSTRGIFMFVELGFITANIDSTKPQVCIL